MNLRSETCTPHIGFLKYVNQRDMMADLRYIPVSLWSIANCMYPLTVWKELGNGSVDSFASIKSAEQGVMCAIFQGPHLSLRLNSQPRYTT